MKSQKKNLGKTPHRQCIYVYLYIMYTDSKFYTFEALLLNNNNKIFFNLKKIKYCFERQYIENLLS